VILLLALLLLFVLLLVLDFLLIPSSPHPLLLAFSFSFSSSSFSWPSSIPHTDVGFGTRRMIWHRLWRTYGVKGLNSGKSSCSQRHRCTYFKTTGTESVVLSWPRINPLITPLLNFQCELSKEIRKAHIIQKR